LGSIKNYSLTSDAGVDKRITSAAAAFGTLKNIFASIFRRILRVTYTRLLPCVLYFTVVKHGPCVNIYSSAFEVSVTGVLVAYAA